MRKLIDRRKLLRRKPPQNTQAPTIYYNDPATAAGEIIGTYIAIGFWIGHLAIPISILIPTYPIEAGKDQPVTSSDLKPYLPQGATIAYPRELIWGFPSPKAQA